MDPDGQTYAEIVHRTNSDPRAVHVSLASVAAVGVVVVAIMAACAPVVQAPVPVPAPTVPNQTPVAASPVPARPSGVNAGSIRGGPWSFSYTPGTYSYTMTTEAEVSPLSDTTQKRAVPAPPEHATITVGPTGAVQVVAPVSQGDGACDLAAATATRARQLIPTLPANMNAGESWTDSTTTDGCRGSVPATSHVVHTYTVLSDTTFAGLPALHVHRDDVIAASGEGAAGQHRILLSATGVGNAELFFDVSTGRFLGSDGVQNSKVDVNTSGRTTRFLQRVTERVALTNTP